MFSSANKCGYDLNRSTFLKNILSQIFYIKIKTNSSYIALWFLDQKRIHISQPTLCIEVLIYPPLREAGVDGGRGGGGSECGPFDVRFGLAKVLQNRPTAADRSLPSRHLKQGV